MSLILKTIITICGAIGMVVTTETVVVELNYGTIPLLIVFTVIFAIGLMTISSEVKKKYKSLTNKKSERI